MFSPNQAQTGKRVYASGGFAPNRGRVSAQGNQGYVRRSLTQQTRQANMHGNEGQAVGATRFGNDGRSDTRSGLARAALNRGAQHQNAGRAPVGQGPAHGGGGGMGHGGGGQHHGGGGQHQGNGGGNGGNAGTPVPRVTIGANGQMQLPYDSSYGQGLYTSLGTFNDSLMALQGQDQQQAAQYGQAVRDENLGYQQQKISDLAGNAGRGMAFTSKYATDVGQTASGHNTAIQDLDAGNAQYLAQSATQRQSYQDQFNQQLAAAASDHAKTASDSGRHIGGRTKKPAGSRRPKWNRWKKNHPNATRQQRQAHRPQHHGGGGGGNNGGGGVHNHIHIHNHGNDNPKPPTKPQQRNRRR